MLQLIFLKGLLLMGSMADKEIRWAEVSCYGIFRFCVGGKDVERDKRKSEREREWDVGRERKRERKKNWISRIKISWHLRK